MRPQLSTVAQPRVLVATLGFVAPLASSAVSRCCTITLCAATPRRRSLTSWPRAVPPGALPPSLTTDETNVYAGEITARVLSEREKKIVAYRQQYKCVGCGCLLPPTHQIDHIVPLALGGTNGLTNLQALCVRCHVRKTRGQRHDMLSSRIAREAAEVKGAALENAAAVAAASPPATLALDALELSSLQLLRGMNQQQLAAVVCADGPLRVAAGPGTGKTRVLTARIAHLVEEARVPPQRVLAVTFTNKAARELRERITRLVGPCEANAITMGTFHSLCLAILRQDITRLPEELPYRSGFAVYDEYSSLKLIKKLKTRLEGGSATGAAKQTAEQKKKDDFSAGAVQSIISAAKNDMYDAQRFRLHPPAKLRALGAQKLRLAAAVFEGYQQTLRDENIIDFDDMLLLTETLLRTSERTRRKYAGHWRHLLVDEFQDTNSVQYQLLSLLARDHKNVFVVGDADQAIYGWRGADIHNQARLDSEFAIRTLPPAVPAVPLPHGAYESVQALQAAVQAIPFPPLPRSGGGRQLNLELNYRSRQGILDMAMRLLSPAYAADPSAQLRLVTPEDALLELPDEQWVDAPSAAAARAAECVQVVQLEDGEHEAEYVVDEILRIRDAALAAHCSHTRAHTCAPTPPSIAILYRTNAQSMAFERRLVREGVPYVLAAQRSFYARKEIRDALAYLQLLRNNDTIALERVLNVPPRKIGATSIQALYAASEACGVSLWRAVELYATSAAPLCDADTALIEGRLPKLRSNVVNAVRGFYELIMRFRALVDQASAAHEASVPLAEEEEALSARGGATALEGDGGEGEEVVRLKMVSSEIRRRLRDPSGRDDEGRAGLGDDWMAEAEVALEAMAAEAEALAEERGGGGARLSEEARDEDRGGGAVGGGGAAGGSGSLAALLQLLLRESGYAAMLDKGGDDEAGRWRNLGELASLAREREVYELDAFLDQISLVSDVDALDEQGQRKSASARGAVQLSTIHGAKGLEFEHVFVTGVEEGLLPHYYCTNDEEEVEQERRLLYVAMTRAKEQLVLTHTAVRARWGKVALCEGSRFLGCLPQELKRAVARLKPRRRNHRPGWRQS